MRGHGKVYKPMELAARQQRKLSLEEGTSQKGIEHGRKESSQAVTKHARVLANQKYVQEIDTDMAMVMESAGKFGFRSAFATVARQTRGS